MLSWAKWSRIGAVKKLKVGKDFSGVKLIQLNSAVYFSEKFSELCSNISRVPGETFQSSWFQTGKFSRVNFRKSSGRLTPAVRSEKVLAVTAPRRDHTAYHSGKKLRKHTWEGCSAERDFKLFAGIISPLGEYLALDLIQRKEVLSPLTWMFQQDALAL